MRESEIEQHLIAKNYHIKKRWLKSCIAYLESSMKINNMQTMIDLIIEQFLNSDIEDSYEVQMKIPKNAVKLMLTRRMIFQVVSHIEISTSVYEQISEATKDEHDLSWFHGEEIPGNEQELHEEQKKKKRGMVKVELNDGVNFVHGIEIADPIFDLNSITPGMKIILTDKVRCRKGILFLDSSNCQTLGGQVEKLNYIPVEKLAKMLNIDLDAEKRRKLLVNEKAAEVRKQKKEKQSKTQSTISPFLVKIDKNKTEKDTSLKGFAFDEIVEIPKKTADVFADDVTFTPIAVEKIPKKQIPVRKASPIRERSFTPIQEEPDVFSQLVDDREFNVFTKKSIQNQNATSYPSFKENERVLKDFDSNPKQQFNPPKINHPVRPVREPSRQLPELKKAPIIPAIIRQPEISRKDPEPTSKLTPAADINVFQISKTKILTRQLLEEAPLPKLPQSEDPEIEIYEPGKLRNVLPNDHTNWNTTIKKEVEDEFMLDASLRMPGFARKSLNLNKSDEIESKRKAVEEFSRNMHGPRSSSTKKNPPTNGMDINMFVTNIRNLKRSENEHKMRQMEVVAPIIHPDRPTRSNFEVEEEGEEEEILISDEEMDVESTSMQYQNPMNLNNTIEKEGLNECRRWKIGYESPAPQTRSDILPTWNPNILTYKISELRPNSQQEISKILKIEPPNGATKSGDSNNNVNKQSFRQSANIQVYKTPLVRRIPSAENSAYFSGELSKRLANLHIVPLRDALSTRKYWMMSKIVVIMPTLCQQMHELQSDGIDWHLKVQMSDTSAKNVMCLVSTDLLNRIFGFTVSDCKRLFDQSQIEVLRLKKIEAEKKLAGFKRLDLIIWLEVSPQTDKMPLIVDVKTISDALNVL